MAVGASGARVTSAPLGLSNVQPVARSVTDSGALGASDMSTTSAAACPSTCPSATVDDEIADLRGLTHRQKRFARVVVAHGRDQPHTAGQEDQQAAAERRDDQLSSGHVARVPARTIVPG